MTKVPRSHAAVPPGCDPDSVVLAFRVPNELDGQRLDRFVHWRIPRLTRERANEIVVHCAYRDDGSRRVPSERVRAGEIVLLVRERFVEPETPQSFGVLYQDEAITVVDKPAGLPVHPSATYHKNTLTSMLRARWGANGPHICHRLDRETSGVVVCAIPGPDEVAVKRQFETRIVAKEYLAIVRGRVEADEMRIDRPLRRASEGLHLRMEPHDDGLPALTGLRVVERRGDRTLVHLEPHTGRQHQLRVHLAAIGHPIVGDKLYGPGTSSEFVEWVETGMTDALRGRLGHERHALHAYRCTIEHPRTGARMTFTAPLASDLEALWASVEP
ncbi:RluA family pseudouridine synthase [Sandaracinus amylolyticus]|uniref:RluA family pseudouridine synthase n=1 Tax=Sandaracinus amylolyticus TaxID=927083 RepID=UPI001F25D004|nr:RluA family pseudouridine synthase [Sandaracinus amylolyticus]UJR80375.1 RNA pseudouridine synthase [Sandaracinus amylolyticus]